MDHTPKRSIIARIMDSRGKSLAFWGLPSFFFFFLTALTGYIPLAVFVLFFTFGLFSAGRRATVKLVDVLTVPLSDGSAVSYAVLKEKRYATYLKEAGFAGLLLSFMLLFNPFFYVPYSVRYYLIKDTVIPDAKPGQRIPAYYTDDAGFFNLQEISKKDCQTYRANPALLAQRYEAETEQDRSCFCEALRPFSEKGFVKEAFSGSTFSLCSMSDLQSSLLLCKYSGQSKLQIGFLIDAETAEKFRSDPSLLANQFIQIMLTAESVTLNDELLLRLMNAKQSSDAPVPDKPLDASAVKTLLHPQVRLKRFWGGVLCFCAISSCMTVAISGMIPLLFGGLFYLFPAILLLRKASHIDKDIQERKYRIEKTECVSINPYAFANGQTLQRPKNTSSAPITGEPAYIISLDGAKPIAVSARKYCCLPLEDQLAEHPDQTTMEGSRL